MLSEVGITIRPIKLEDLDKVVDLIVSIDPSLQEVVEIEVVERYQSGRLSQGFFVAETPDGTIQGVMGFQEDPWEAPDIRWVNWLYVAPAYRKRGIATCLYHSIENLLKSSGCRKVYLDVGAPEHHQDAIRFHLRNGFALEGHLVDYWAQGEPLLIFGKQLNGE